MLLCAWKPKYASVGSDKSPSDALNLKANVGNATEPVNGILPSALASNCNLTPVEPTPEPVAAKKRPSDPVPAVTGEVGVMFPLVMSSSAFEPPLKAELVATPALLML